MTAPSASNPILDNNGTTTQSLINNNLTTFLLPDLTGDVKPQDKYPAAHGGFADVWICNWENETGLQKVAVKVLRCPSDNTDEKNKLNKRLRRELEVWRKLRHPRILPLFGIVSDFGPYFSMVCPWKENGNLNTYLVKCGNELSEDDRTRILLQVAEGLAYLHSHSIVHGDLTGSNVLIDGAGNACLCDFGLSTLTAELHSVSNLTSSIGGNVRFAAPEMYRFSDNSIPSATPCSDIYSFGSIMLQTLTGKLPYHNMRSDGQVLIALARGIRPQRPLEPPIADNYWSFMNYCWAEGPVDRPTIQDVIVYLQDTKGLQVLQRSTPWDYKGRIQLGSLINMSHDMIFETWTATLLESGNSMVVVKLIRIETVGPRKESILISLQKLQMISHDNLLPFLGMTTEFEPFIGVVSPWLEVTNLCNFLSLTRTSVSELKRRQILSDVAHGLQYLHSLSLVHGGLTGWNILLSDDGPAQLTNYGLMPIVAERMPTTPFAAICEEDVRWADPALWSKTVCNPFIIPAHDVYAFGSVMLQVLTTRVPYQYLWKYMEIPLAKLRHYYNLRPERPSNDMVSEQQWALMVQCWDPDIQRRPSMDMVMQQLKEIMPTS